MSDSLPANRVVVAHDNPDMRDYLQTLLAGSFDVEAVASGKLALDAIRRERPALVLTDVMMPDPDGFGLIAEIRRDSSLRTLPVVTLSARAGEEPRIDGANACIVGPFSARELVGCVRAQIEIARVRADTRKTTDELALVLSTVPVAIIHIDTEERLRFANEFYLSDTGRTPDKVYGRTVRELVGEPAYARILPYLRRALSGENVSFEVRAQVGAAGERDVYVRYAPRVDSEGNAIGVIGVIQDITDREQAVQALRDSEEHLRIATQTAGLQTWEIDVTSDLVTTSSYLSTVLNRDIPVTVQDALLSVHEEDRDRVYREFERTVATGEPLDVEYRLHESTRESVWLHAHGVLIKGGVAGRARMVGITQNITDRKQREEELRLSAERLSLASLAARVYTWEVDLATGKVFNSANADEVRGSAAPKTIDEGNDMVHPADRELVSKNRQRAIDKCERLDNEYRIVHPETGAISWMRTQGTVICDNDRVPRRLLGMTQNITEQKKLEHDLRRSREELELRVGERTAELQQSTDMLTSLLDDRARLLRKIVDAQEEERQRIARELHDEMGQHLTALKVGLESMEGRYAPATLRRMRDIVGRIDGAIDQLSLELRPAALDDVGLDAAISQLVEQFSSASGIAVDVHTLPLTSKRLSESIETSLYRILQEALTNVWRHSGAKAVSIVLDKRSEQIQMIVEDNGHGFDVEENRVRRRNSFGLLGIKERVTLGGGTFTIESNPGVGTSLFVRLPRT